MASQAFVVLVGIDTLVVNARASVQRDLEVQSGEERRRLLLDDGLPDHLSEPLGIWLI